MMGKNLNSRISVEEDRLDFLVGDYCRFSRVPESDIFVIAFSGANVPLGKFNYTNSFLGAKFNVIYLNDRLDGYYQNGIPGLADDLHATISELRSLISNFSDKPRIFTFGCSMGGYGAILYGTLLEVEAILAFGPTVPIFSSLLRGKSFYAQCARRFENLNSKLKTSITKSHIFFGDRSLVDIFSYEYFHRLSNGKVRIYKDMCHALVYVFSQRESLSNLVLRFISDEDAFDVPDFGFSEYVGLSIPRSIVDLSNVYFRSGSCSDLIEEYFDLDIEFGLSVFSACAELYFKSDLEKSKKYFMKSLCYGFNGKVLSFIIPSLNDQECQILFHLMDDLLACNPSMIGFDASEKRMLSEFYTSLYAKYYRSASILISEFPEGYLDSYDGDFVRGWAYDTENIPAIISIYIGDVFVADVTASDFRGDLKSKGKGVDGCCAFTLALGLDNLLKISPVTSPIQIHARDIKQRRLKYSGSYLKRPVILSSLDVNQNGLLSGWVANYTYPDSNLDYYLYLNGKYCMKFTPDVHRGDVVSKGLDMAKGFKIDVSPFCDIKEKNMIDILYGDVLTVFSGLQLSGADL